MELHGLSSELLIAAFGLFGTGICAIAVRNLREEWGVYRHGASCGCEATGIGCAEGCRERRKDFPKAASYYVLLSAFGLGIAGLALAHFVFGLPIETDVSESSIVVVAVMSVVLVVRLWQWIRRRYRIRG